MRHTEAEEKASEDNTQKWRRRETQSGAQTETRREEQEEEGGRGSCGLCELIRAVRGPPSTYGSNKCPTVSSVPKPRDSDICPLALPGKAQAPILSLPGRAVCQPHPPYTQPSARWIPEDWSSAWSPSPAPELQSPRPPQSSISLPERRRH